MVIFNSYVSHYQRVSYQNGLTMVKLPPRVGKYPRGKHVHITTKKVEQHAEGVRYSDEHRSLLNMRV